MTAKGHSLQSVELLIKQWQERLSSLPCTSICFTANYTAPRKQIPGIKKIYYTALCMYYKENQH